VAIDDDDESAAEIRIELGVWGVEEPEPPPTPLRSQLVYHYRTFHSSNEPSVEESFKPPIDGHPDNTHLNPPRGEVHVSESRYMNRESEEGPMRL